MPLRPLDRSLEPIARAWRSADAGRGARWLAYCAIVGVVAGLAGLAFDFLSSGAVHLFLEVLAGWSPARPGGERSAFAPSDVERNLALLAFMPAIGGLVSGALVAWLAPEASGHGTDAAIDAYHRRDGVIRPRVPLVKIVASAITLGSGGSGGREGPIAQAGAGFGSFIATRLRLSVHDRRVLLAAGMGAGIGSIFRAPLAGALFAAEILYSSAEFEASVLIPACVASIIAYSVFTLVHGTGTLFRTPELAFSGPLELVGYSLLTLVLAAYGFAYVRTLYGTHAVFARWRFPAALKPAIGGLCTGAIAMALLYAWKDEDVLAVLGFGYGIVQHALDAQVTGAGSIGSVGPLGGATIGAGLLAAVALGKIATTSTTIGSGGSAGVFGPSMVIGGCAGGAVGLVLHSLWPSIAPQPAAFAVVGMAGFFAGIAKTPISSLVMVSEITGSYSLLIPSMWVCVLCFAISHRWKLYASQVPSRVDSPAHRSRFAVDVLHGIPIAASLSSTATLRALRSSDSLDELVRVAAEVEQATFPVVDAQGELVGLVLLDDLRAVVRDVEIAELGAVVAHDLMRTEFPRLCATDDLASAMRALDAADLDELPVWDARAHAVAGLVTRRHVTRAYVERQGSLIRGRERGTG